MANSTRPLGCEDAGVADTADGAPLLDPADRGVLEVRDRAVATIVAAATLQSPGVHRHGTGLGRLAGRDLPRVDVDVAGDHVRAHVDIAVEWGRPLGVVAAATMRGVRDALSVQSGLTVDRVTVHVATVIPPEHSGVSRKALT
jgi:uncharacterized alkaline shock family protein YloU